MLLIAVLTLAVGIGANVTIFSYVDEIWLRPMMVRQPDRVVSLRVASLLTKNQGSGETADSGYSYPDFMDLRAQAKSFSGIVMLDQRGSLLSGRTEDRSVTTAVVSDNFFDVMQVTPALGRTFTESEAGTPGSRMVLLSYPFWKSQYQGDRSLIGRTIVLSTQEVTVLGILPRGFRGPSEVVQDVWMPVTTRDEGYARGRRDRRGYEVYGRLRDGVTLSQANAELASIAANLAQTYPDSNNGRNFIAIPERQSRAETSQTSLVLLAIAGLVLLIACANVATLLYTRADHRRHEIATRVALGASRWHIVRQLIIESVIIGALSTAAALTLAYGADRLMPVLLPQSLAVGSVDAHLSLRALGFALAAGLGSVFLFGVLPSRQASSLAPVEVLKQRRSSGRFRARVRSVLVVAQVALSLVLVVGTGLLVRTVQKIAASDPGFNAHQNMLVANVIPALALREACMQKCGEFAQESRRRIEALPGVTGTAVSFRIPFGSSGSQYKRKVFLPGVATGSANDGVPIYANSISDSFFEVLGTRLIRGRTINAHEVQTGARVMVVNQWMANRFWPNADPVGKRVGLDKPDGNEYEVVGVVENGIYAEFGESPKPYLFAPMSPYEYGVYDLAVATSGSPESVAAAVRSTLHDLNPSVPVTDMRTLRTHVREAMYAQRLTSTLVGTLGALGLLLAAVGLYGVMTFLVERRRQEIGIQLALGAPRSNVFSSVLGRALTLTGIGIALGIAGAIAATRALSTLLFGVTASDSVSFIAAVLVLAVVGCGAALLPAFRATRVDPMAALRYE